MLSCMPISATFDCPCFHANVCSSGHTQFLDFFKALYLTGKALYIATVWPLRSSLMLFILNLAQLQACSEKSKNTLKPFALWKRPTKHSCHPVSHFSAACLGNPVHLCLLANYHKMIADGNP